MDEARRKKTDQTLSEAMGLKPFEPLVAKIFWPRELFDGMLNGDIEAASALQAIAKVATSEQLPRCLICETRVMFPGMAVVIRSASQGPVGVTGVVCEACANSDDIRDDIIEAIGLPEIKTSTTPS